MHFLKIYAFNITVSLHSKGTSTNKKNRQKMDFNLSLLKGKQPKYLETFIHRHHDGGNAQIRHPSSLILILNRQWTSKSTSRTKTIATTQTLRDNKVHTTSDSAGTTSHKIGSARKMTFKKNQVVSNLASNTDEFGFVVTLNDVNGEKGHKMTEGNACETVWALLLAPIAAADIPALQPEGEVNVCFVLVLFQGGKCLQFQWVFIIKVSTVFRCFHLWIFLPFNFINVTLHLSKIK